MKEGISMLNSKLPPSKAQFLPASFAKGSILTGFTTGFAPSANKVRRNPYTLNVVTDADWQYIQRFEAEPYGENTLNGFAAANNYILSLFNIIQPLYQNQYGINIAVSLMHGWLGRDPYDNYGIVTPKRFRSHTNDYTWYVWNAYVDYWETTYKNQFTYRDAVVMFTGKPVRWSLANYAVICNYDGGNGASYVMIGGDAPVNVMADILAHEIAHLFGAGHISQADLDMYPSCYNSIQGAANENYPFYGNSLRTCTVTDAEIGAYMQSGRTWCLQ
jgi:hypothetical protein